MVLKEVSGLERSKLINGLERSQLMNGLERTILPLSIIWPSDQHSLQL